MKTKSIVFLVSLLFLSVIAMSQELSIWTPETVVLYRGIENPISINLRGTEIKDLKITSVETVTITNKNGKISVFVPVDFKDNELEICIEKLNSEKQEKKSSHKLKVIDVPVPIVGLGKLNMDVKRFSKEEILDNLYFVVNMPESFPYDIKYEIISYDFMIETDGAAMILQIPEGKIGENVKTQIEKAKKPVHEIMFINVTLQGPNGINAKTTFSFNLFNGWEE